MIQAKWSDQSSILFNKDKCANYCAQVLENNNSTRERKIHCDRFIENRQGDGYDAVREQQNMNRKFHALENILHAHETEMKMT